MKKNREKSSKMVIGAFPGAPEVPWGDIQLILSIIGGSRGANLFASSVAFSRLEAKQAKTLERRRPKPCPVPRGQDSR